MAEQPKDPNQAPNEIPNRPSPNKKEPTKDIYVIEKLFNYLL